MRDASNPLKISYYLSIKSFEIAKEMAQYVFQLNFRIFTVTANIVELVSWSLGYFSETF